MSAASGAYSGEGGRAQVSLYLGGSGASRPVSLVFRSLPCQGAPQCVQLDGVLSGRMMRRPGGIPDTGQSDSITASGRLTTLGRVTATGVSQGTGFIARGHELLELTLTSRSGRVTLRAMSGSVGTFSSP